MDGHSNNIEVTCCFCGEELYLSDAATLTIQPNYQSEEKQHLFCHKKHLIELISKNIPLHPDFFDESIDNK